MFRIIHLTNGDREQIIFTEDLTINAEDFCSRGFLVENDNQYNGNLPSNFPLESTFNKEN